MGEIPEKYGKDTSKDSADCINRVQNDLKVRFLRLMNSTTNHGIAFCSGSSMKELNTRYGMLHGVVQETSHAGGTPDLVFLNAPNLLHLPFASVVPLHHIEDHGRRRETPILFYPNGGLRSLPLQASTLIPTSCGILPAEALTFYSTGEIRKVFPTAGKLSGYWTEEQEQEHAPLCQLRIASELVSAKVINVHFYKSGALQSVTLWPKERISLRAAHSTVQVRTGVSFYANGSLKSYEPAEPVLVNTPIGDIMAYDNQPLGVSADVNSLQFAPTGEVVGVTTVSSRVQVFPSDRMPEELGPYRVQSFCEEADTEVRALRLRFEDGWVLFFGEHEEHYPLADTQFATFHSKQVPLASCCSG